MVERLWWYQRLWSTNWSKHIGTCLDYPRSTDMQQNINTNRVIIPDHTCTFGWLTSLMIFNVQEFIKYSENLTNLESFDGVKCEEPPETANLRPFSQCNCISWTCFNQLSWEWKRETYDLQKSFPTINIILTPQVHLMRFRTWDLLEAEFKSILSKSVNALDFR